MKPDTTTIAVDQDGTIHAMTAAESDGSQAGPILSLSAKGWAEQSTTTGKNLLPNDATSQTINGITFTVNADGSITINGTASAGISFSIKKGISLPSDTYTLSSVTNVPSNVFLSIQTDAGNKSVAGNKNSETFTAAPSGQCWIFISSGTVVNNLTIYPQLELGSTATEYEPYTGGAPSPSPDYPQEIRVARGRNLLDISSSPTRDKATVDVHDGSVTVSATSASGWSYAIWTVPISRAGSYVASIVSRTDGAQFSVEVMNGNDRELIASTSALNSVVVTASANTTSIRVWLYSRQSDSGSADDSFTYYGIQLERGSTPTPYVPYGCVGVDVYDGSTHVTTIPIPLPTRGWVGALPNGTADTLTLDGAGKCEWTLPTSEATFDGSSDEGWNQQAVYTNNARYSFTTDAAFNKSNGGQLLCSHLPEGNAGSDSMNIDLHGSQRMIQMTVPYLTVADFKAWLSTHNVTVLYPLATPVTEDMGYIEMPQIPVGAEITIPELDDLGVRYIVDDAASELARMWYERAYAELGDAIVELAGRVTTLENA